MKGASLSFENHTFSANEANHGKVEAHLRPLTPAPPPPSLLTGKYTTLIAPQTQPYKWNSNKKHIINYSVQVIMNTQTQTQTCHQTTNISSSLSITYIIHNIKKTNTNMSSKNKHTIIINNHNLRTQYHEYTNTNMSSNKKHIIIIINHTKYKITWIHKHKHVIKQQTHHHYHHHHHILITNISSSSKYHLSQSETKYKISRIHKYKHIVIIKLSSVIKI